MLKKTIDLFCARCRFKNPIYGVLLFSLVLFSIGINWGLPNIESWMSDSLAPFHPLIGLSKGFSFGYFNKYPLVHQVILAVLNLPVVITAVIASNPLEGLQLFKFLVLLRSPEYATALMLIDNSVSVIMGTLIIYFIYLGAREIFDERTAVYSALIASFNVVLNFYAHTAKVEVPYVFWATAALYYLIRIARYERTQDYVWCAVLTCLSFGTKDQAYAVFIVPFILFLAVFQAARDRGSVSIIKTVFRKNIWKFAGVFILCAIIIENMVFNYDGFLMRFHHLTGDGGQRSIGYTLDIWGISALFCDNVSGIMNQVIGIPFFIISVGGLILTVLLYRKNKRELLLKLFYIFPLISYYLFFVQFIRQSNPRFLLPLSLFLSVFGGFMLAYLHEKSKHTYTKVFVFGLVMICLYSFYKTISVNVTMLYDVRYLSEDWMRKNIPSGSTIEYYDYLHYLPRFPEGTRAYRIKKNFLEIEQRMPDYIILSERVAFISAQMTDPERGKKISERKIRSRTSERTEFYGLLINGTLKYRLAEATTRNIPFFEDVSALRISPMRILIFKRIEADSPGKYIKSSMAVCR